MIYEKNVSFVLIIILIGLELSCSNQPENNNNRELETEMKTPVIDQSTDSTMKKLTVKVGEEILFELPESEDGSYSWYYEVSEDWIISMTEPYDYPSRSAGKTEGSNPGDPDMKKFNIKGLKRGEVTIRFYLGRLGERNLSPPAEELVQIEVI